MAMTEHTSGETGALGADGPLSQGGAAMPTRRGLIAAFGVGAAIAATPLAAATMLKGEHQSSAEWDAAYARWIEVEAHSQLLWDRHTEAEERAGDAHPRIDRYFDEYRLGIGMKRDDVEFWLNHYVAWTGKQIDVRAVADEFDAYQRAGEAADRKFNVRELLATAQAHMPAFHEARDGLMAIPAPHLAALVTKLTIALTSLDDEHGESALADVRRLIGGRA